MVTYMPVTSRPLSQHNTYDRINQHTSYVRTIISHKSHETASQCSYYSKEQHGNTHDHNVRTYLLNREQTAHVMATRKVHTLCHVWAHNKMQMWKI